MDSILGLPAHPLLVHGVVVLLPLAALGAVVAAVSPTWRDRIGWVSVGLAGVGVVLTFLAKESGEALEEAVERMGGDSRLLEAHTEMGDLALAWALPLFLVLLGFMAYHAYRARNGQPPLPLASGLSIALIALVVLASATTTFGIVRIGHSGAEATWEDVRIAPGTEAGEDERREMDEDEELEGMGVPGAVTAPVAR